MNTFPPQAMTILEHFTDAMIESADSPTDIRTSIYSQPTGKYYLSHELIDKTTLQLTDYGTKILTTSKGNDYPAFANTVYTILSRSKSFHGKWLKLAETSEPEEYYQFQANGQGDAAFCYCQFLYELGLLADEPVFASGDEEGCFSIRFSQLGKEIQHRMRLNSTSPIMNAGGIQISEGANVTLVLMNGGHYMPENSGVINANEGNSESTITN